MHGRQGGAEQSGRADVSCRAHGRARGGEAEMKSGSRTSILIDKVKVRSVHVPEINIE